MGWIEDEVDVLVVEVEDEVDREGLGSSSPRFMPLRGHQFLCLCLSPGEPCPTFEAECP